MIDVTVISTVFQTANFHHLSDHATQEKASKDLASSLAARLGL